jgi:hypothetical protein
MFNNNNDDDNTKVVILLSIITLGYTFTYIALICSIYTYNA